MHIDGGSVFLYLCFVIMLPIMALACRLDGKIRSGILLGVRLSPGMETDEETAAIAGRYRRNLRLVLLLLFLLTLPTLVIPYVSVCVTWLLLWMNGVLVSYFLVYLRAHRQLTARKAERFPCEDDDRFWKWGQLYCNPEDKSFLVTGRTELNTGVNIAGRTGKGFMIFVVVLLAVMPLLGVGLLYDEFSPIRLTLTDTSILAEHAFTSYEIPLEDVEALALAETLPNCSKLSGVALDTLYKGTFSAKGIGAFEACCDPRNAPFLQITTAKDTYVFGDRDGSVQEIYALLVSGIK